MANTKRLSEFVCKKCGTEMRVVSVVNRITNDDSPDTPTKLYRVSTLACTNPKCSLCYKEKDKSTFQEMSYEQPIS